MKSARIALFAVLLIASVSSASMQVTPGAAARAVEWQVTQSELLRGVKSFQISVEEPSNDEQACGITRDALRLAAARPVLDGALAVLPVDSMLVRYGITSSPTLYVNVTGYQLTGGEGCAAYVEVKITDTSWFTPSYQQDPLAALGSLALLAPWPGDRAGEKSARPVRVALGTVVLLEEGLLLTGLQTGFSARVIDFVRRTVDGFVTQIKLANQGTSGQ